MVTVKEVDYWKDKLFDSSKRNKLLNCTQAGNSGKISRTSLLIVSPESEEMWKLFSNTEGKIVFTEKEGHVAADPQINVKTGQKESEAYKTLLNLKKRTETIIEEKGINVLYLAFGFLNWRDPNGESKSLKSPVLLVPIKLSQESESTEIILSRLDDEIIVNSALRYRLSDFGVQMPELEKTMTCTGYLNCFSELIKDYDWHIISDYIQLSLFAVFKADMHNDLCNNEKKLYENEVIKAFNKGIEYDSEVRDMAVLEENDISFVIDESDDAVRNGTIAKIIDSAAARNKKILLISENTANLENIYEELENAGVDDRCLKLYGNNILRNTFVDQFRQSSDNPWYDCVSVDMDENTEKLVDQYSGRLVSFAEAAEETFKTVSDLFGNTGIDQSLKGAKEILEFVELCMNSPGMPKYWLDTDVDIRIKDIIDQTAYVTKFDVEVSKITEYGAKFKHLVSENSDITIKAESDEYNIKRVEYGNIQQHFSSYLNDEQKNTIKGHHKSFYEHILICQKLNDECSKYLALDGKNTAKLQLITQKLLSQKNAAIDIEKKMKDVENRLSKLMFDKEVISVNAEEMLLRYKESYHSSLRFLNNDYNNDRKLLMQYYHGEEKMSLQLMSDVLENVSEYKRIEVGYDKQMSVVNQTISKRKLIETETALNKEQFRQRAVLLKSELNKLQEMRKYYISDIENIISYYLDSELALITKVRNKKKNLITMLNVKVSGDRDFEQLSEKIEWVSLLKKNLSRYNISQKEIIEKICRRDRDTVMKLGNLKTKLRNFVTEIERSLDKLSTVFSDIVKDDLQDQKLTELKNRFSLCRQNKDGLKRVQLYNRLVKSAREDDKYTTSMVRDEFENILVQRPCIMTSPLMVSRFFADSSVEFDTVIFYQASQLRIRDAICSVLRAKQIIAAGDSKKNMPADFFAPHSADQINDRSLFDEAQALPVAK